MLEMKLMKLLFEGRGIDFYELQISQFLFYYNYILFCVGSNLLSLWFFLKNFLLFDTFYRFFIHFCRFLCTFWYTFLTFWCITLNRLIEFLYILVLNNFSFTTKHFEHRFFLATITFYFDNLQMHDLKPS